MRDFMAQRIERKKGHMTVDRQVKNFVLLQVLGMGLSGQVRIRRNRKIASYLLRLANQSVVVSAHIGKN